MPRTVAKKDRFFGLFEKLRQPDITGSKLFWGYPVNANGNYGAFGCSGDAEHPILASGVDQTTTAHSHLTFSAKNSTALYGQAQTVQPNSLRLLAVIKA